MAVQIGVNLDKTKMVRIRVANSRMTTKYSSWVATFVITYGITLPICVTPFGYVNKIHNKSHATTHGYTHQATYFAEYGNHTQINEVLLYTVTVATTAVHTKVVNHTANAGTNEHRLSCGWLHYVHFEVSTIQIRNKVFPVMASTAVWDTHINGRVRIRHVGGHVKVTVIRNGMFGVCRQISTKVSKVLAIT